MDWKGFESKIHLRKLFKQDKKYDWYLISVIAALCLSGIAFLASASSIVSTTLYNNEIFLLIRQISLGLWFGFVLAFILSQVDYHNLYKIRKHLLLVSFLLLAWLAIAESLYKFRLISSPEAFHIGPIRPISTNGATRWIELGSLFRFQPVEFTKFALLVYTSSFFYKRELENKANEPITFFSLKKELYAILTTLTLIVMQPDLGSTLLVFSVSFGAFYVCNIPRKIILSVLGVILGLVVLTSLPSINHTGANTNYRYDRVQTFINSITGKNTETNDLNLHTTRVQDAISNGGLWGQGYGNSQYKKRNLIPEVQTDAIISVIGEEMGFIKTLLFLSLYFLLAQRGLKVAFEAPDLFGRGLAAGIIFWISGQTLLNIMSFLNLIPLTGVPLPFVSYGSTSLLINLAAMGVLINISSFSATRNQTVNPTQIRRPKYTLM
jgi:cell division protein FtsW